jgi:hypothetical protein
MMTFSPGLFYQVTFGNGETAVFRYLGPNGRGQQEIEVSPGSGRIDTFERLVPGAYVDLVEVDDPDE